MEAARAAAWAVRDDTRDNARGAARDAREARKAARSAGRDAREAARDARDAWEASDIRDAAARTACADAWAADSAAKAARADAWAAAWGVASHTEEAWNVRYSWKAARDIQVALLRDIFGNPWRKYTWTDIHACSPSGHELQFLSRRWLTWNDGGVVKIALTFYDERRFKDMPILADALEEAGCQNEDMLTHCRAPAEHVRGCWVVDLLLGKT